MSSPLQTLLAFVLVLAAGFSCMPCAQAQASKGAATQAADDSAPPRLPPWSWPTTPSHLRIAAALREARRASPNDSPLLQQRIVESGRDAVAAQVDIMLRNRVPETSPKDGPQILNEAQHALLLSALGSMPGKSVRSELDTRLALTPDDKNARLGAIHVLGLIGEPKDFARMVELAPRKPASPELALPSASREALRSAVASILRRVPQAWPALGVTLRQVDSSAAKVLLDALGSARDPRALRILLETARNDRKLAWKAVSIVPACGSSLDRETDREFLEWMRTEFNSAEAGYGRTLLMAVGTLDDGDWIPLLVERLEDEDSGIREESLSALRRITGLGFPADPAVWRRWNEAEERWHAQRRPRLFEELNSAESPTVLAAVREYSEHRTHRAAMAEELLKVLEHGRPEVRGMVVGILARLGSPAACPALLGMLGDSDAKVGEAAWQALQTISGMQISRDPEVLRELFGRS